MPLNFTETQSKYLKYSYIPGFVFLLTYFLGIVVLGVDTNSPLNIIEFDYDLETKSAKTNINYFGYFAFIFMWMWAGLIRNNVGLALKLSLSAVLIFTLTNFEVWIGIDLKNYIPIPILIILYFLINPFSLFGVAYALFTGKKDTILVHFLMGILISQFIYLINEPWQLMHIYLQEEIEKLSRYRFLRTILLLRYASIVITPILVYAGYFFVENLYQKKKTIKSFYNGLFSQFHPISTQSFRNIYPILYWATFSCFLAFSYDPELPIQLLYGNGIAGKIIGIFGYTLKILAFFITIKLLSTIIIGRIQTLKSPVSWSYFWLFVPIINLIPYTQFVTREIPVNQLFDKKIAINQTKKFSFHFANVLTILLVLHFFILILASQISFPLIIGYFLLALFFFAFRLKKYVFKVIVGLLLLFLIYSVVHEIFTLGHTRRGSSIYKIGKSPELVFVLIGFLYYLKLGFFPEYIDDDTDLNLKSPN